MGEDAHANNKTRHLSKHYSNNSRYRSTDRNFEAYSTENRRYSKLPKELHDTCRKTENYLLPNADNQCINTTLRSWCCRITAKKSTTQQTATTVHLNVVANATT